MLRWIGMIGLLAALASLVPPRPAATQVLGSFQTPNASPPCPVGTVPCPAASGFACQFDGRGLTCFPADYGWMASNRTRRCTMNNSPAFRLRVTGGASMVCDEMNTGEETPKLADGAIWERAGLRCENQRDAVRCTNREGHGFHLRNRRQDLF